MWLSGYDLCLIVTLTYQIYLGCNVFIADFQDAIRKRKRVPWKGDGGYTRVL